MVGGRVSREAEQLVADELARPLRVAGGDDGVAGAGDEADQVDSLGQRAARVGEELQRGLVVLGGLVGTADRHGVVAGLDAGPQRGVEVVGGPGVPGQLGGRAVDAAAADRLGVGGVQADPLARQQVVVDRLGEQGVPEGVALGADPDEDVRLHGGPQRPLEVVGALLDDRAEQRVGDPAAGHRGSPDHGPALVVEAVQAHEQQVGEVVGEPLGAELGGDELLGEERVALGPVDDADQVGGGDVAAVQGPDEAAYVVVRERRQLEAVDAGDPDPLGDGGAERVAAVQVVAAVGGHDGHGPRNGRVNRKLRRSRVDRSAQWASSTTTSRGASAAMRSSAPCTASKISARSGPSPGTLAPPESSRRPGWRCWRAG